MSAALPSSTAPSWQSLVVHLLVRARMRRYALAPIDPSWVRDNMGRPRAARRWMAGNGVEVERIAAVGHWPGGEQVRSPAATARSPIVLYLHGGGYIACSPETHRMLVASIVRRVGGTAYVPQYRLAPEHPYPAALHDARGAYRYLIDTCGIDPSRIVIAGDSAGGGLALCLALSLRDDTVPMPAAVVTFSPWTDLASTGSSLDENTDRCAMFAGDTIRRAAAFYVGRTEPTVPTLSPLYGDFSGLPPMLVHASRDEVLRDDAVRVAARAAAAGVTVSLRLWSRVPHVWQFFAAVLPEARESLADAAAFILHHTTPAAAEERAPPRE